jgi:hypothetical protein
VAGKSPKEASENFAFFLRETLNCVTDQELLAYQESDKIHKITFKDPAVLTSTDGTEYYLSVSQAFTIVPKDGDQFKAHSREYSYIFSDSDTISNHGIVSYHWHPHISDLRDPHLHLHVRRHAESSITEKIITRAHYPTSRICLEDFLWLLIRYYKITPLNRKWKSILKKNKAAFAKGATWFVAPPE